MAKYTLLANLYFLRKKPLMRHCQKDDGIVTLSGQVPSEQDKSSIEMTVNSVNGVKRVYNSLTVKS